MSTALLRAPALCPSVSSTPIESHPTSLAVSRIRLCGRLLAILLCGLHVYTFRHAMNPDGISYLDVADAYGRGDLRGAVNTYWSPLFSWVLAVANGLVQPGPYWDAALAHGVCFAGVLLSLLTFEWLLAEVLRLHRARQAESEIGGCTYFPEWLVVALAYAGFIWTSRWLVTLSRLTPDSWVAAIVYAMPALLLRMRREPERLGLGLWLGALIGIGYLTKSVLLPLGVVALGTACWMLPRDLRWKQTLRAGAVAAVLAGGWIAVLSLDVGRLTTGEAGRLNYLWYVNQQLHPKDFGQAGMLPRTEGVRLLVESPPVVLCDFGSAGSIPFWYEPSVFADGMVAHWSIGQQIHILGTAAVYFCRLIYHHVLGPAMVLLLLALCAGWFRKGTRTNWMAQLGTGLWAGLPLGVIALSAMGLYLLVGVVEGRLLGPFLLLGWLVLIPAIPIERGSEHRSHRTGVIGITVLLVLIVGGLVVDGQAAVASIREGESVRAHPHWQVAEELRRAGMQPGDRVATVGEAFWSYWARLGQFRLVAMVPTGAGEQFRQATADEKEQVFEKLRAAGVRAVVTRSSEGTPVGWNAVAGTEYAFRTIGGTAK